MILLLLSFYIGGEIMDKYSVLNIENGNDFFLVIANTYENPINELLCNRYVPFVEKGNVIFDLAIINGINFNRFVQATVVNHRLQEHNIKIISDVPKDILELSKKYFEKNQEVVRLSTLPSTIKYLLVNA